MMSNERMLGFIMCFESNDINHPHIKWIRCMGGDVFETHFSNKQSIKTTSESFNQQDLGMKCFLDTCCKSPLRKFEFNGPNPWNPHCLTVGYTHFAMEAISKLVSVDHVRWALFALGPYVSLKQLLQHIQQVGNLDCMFVARSEYDIMTRIYIAGKFLVMSRSHVFYVIDGYVHCCSTSFAHCSPQHWSTRAVLGLMDIDKIYEVIPLIRKRNKRMKTAADRLSMQAQPQL